MHVKTPELLKTKFLQFLQFYSRDFIKKLIELAFEQSIDNFETIHTKI